MNRKNLITILALLSITTLFISCASKDKELAISEPIPETFKLEGQELKLKGQGFKIGEKFGFTAKVYKAGFYTDNAKASADELLAGNNTKVIYMRFVYAVTKGMVEEGWTKAFPHSCVEECEKSKIDFRSFLEFVPSMTIGDEMTIVFRPDGVRVDVKGSKSLHWEIGSAVFSRNLLRVFIGPKVLDEKFKSQLLGLATP